MTFVQLPRVTATENNMLETRIGSGARARRTAFALAAAALLAGVAAGQLRAATASAPRAYVTSEKGGVGVIDLDQMALVATFPVGADGPRGLGLTADGRRLLVANKNTGDIAEIDTATGKVARRLAIGKNPEYLRVHGNLAYVTYEPGESGGPPSASAPGQGGAHGDDDDAHKPPAQIAIVDLAAWRVAHRVQSGHETEGVEFSRDDRQLLVTNEGDNTVSVHDARTGRLLRTIALADGGRPRGIKLSPDGREYVVTLEAANKFVVLDAHDFHVVKTVDTKVGPYGVAFGPKDQRLFVLAARQQTLQVFDAHSYGHVADVPVGQRCWHFSFTPDGSQLLVACGRSNAVYVFDAQTYQPVKQIGDLPLAWGIVTWPRGDGSIDSVR